MAKATSFVLLTSGIWGLVKILEPNLRRLGLVEILILKIPANF